MKKTTPKKSTGRPCKLCNHPDVKKINAMMAQVNPRVSFRDISRQTGIHWSSVISHAENHLNLQIGAMIAEQKIENAIDHWEEIREQLQFAKDLRKAARKYLMNEETNEIELFPRSDEVTVVYLDYTDTTAHGQPKKKRDSLDRLLARAENANVEAVQTIIKHVDIRSFSLNAIETTDLVLDKIAKLEGLYQKAKENQETIDLTAKNIVRSAQLYPGADLDKLIESAATDSELNKKVLSAKVYSILGNIENLETVQ